MARPPIIISNGGVIDLLAEGCANKSENEVADQIKDNVARLNVEEKDGYKTKVVVIKKAGGNTPCLYWRLSSDQDTHFPGHGKEGVSINDIIDNTI